MALRVPTVEGPSVNLQGVPDGYQRAPQALGEAERVRAEQLGAVSELAQRVQDDADRARVDDALNSLNARDTDLTFGAEGYSKLRGRDALQDSDGRSPADVYDDQYRKDIGALASGLGNDRQRQAFHARANDMQANFRRRLMAHTAAEQRTYEEGTAAAKVTGGQQRMTLGWSDPLVREQARTDIQNAILQAGVSAGASPEQVTAATVRALSPAHVAVLASAVTAGNYDFANAYLDQHADEMLPDALMQAREHLKAGTNAAQAMDAATEIWASLGPKTDGQPVELDKMEAAARERFKGDPLKVKGTIAELRDRAAAQNASEAERAAGNTNAVMLAYSKGSNLNRLQAMPEFLALPGKQQADIVQHVSDRQHMMWARSIEDQNRLAAEQAKRAFPAFLTYSDPERLASMSRTQVQALLPTLGDQLTDHLVTKWDSLQNKTNRIDAKVDTDDFNDFADQLGLHPFAKTNSEDRKRQLGELRFRVEQLIDREQKIKKAPLDRQEKRTLMQQEMARQVIVERTILPNTTSSVIQLTPEQAARVVVPAVDRQQIVEALTTMYARTKAPDHAPTESNIRRLYLQRLSPAAALIPQPNGQ